MGSLQEDVQHTTVKADGPIGTTNTASGPVAAVGNPTATLPLDE